MKDREHENLKKYSLVIHKESAESTSSTCPYDH